MAAMTLEECPFCRRAVTWREDERLLHALARCECSAIGVWFGVPADADEGAIDLLQALGLEGAIAPAPQPVGASGMLTAVYIDPDGMTGRLQSYLHGLGYRLAVARGQRLESGESWAYWAIAGGGALLETPRLLLRELEEADAPAVHAWESDPDVMRYQSLDVATLDDTLAYIRRVRLDAAQRPRLLHVLGAERRDDGLLIGRVGLRVSRPEHREGELWFAFRRDVWGQGYGPEAAGALLDLAFGSLGLHRVHGDCDPRNARSARLMEKLGMVREGHLRETWWLKGEWCDSWIYSVLDRDWSSRSRLSRSRQSR
jgi:[ribosomal protein S5]-alanine N-acetyltransferase